jgi:hypothetical protein
MALGRHDAIVRSQRSAPTVTPTAIHMSGNIRYCDAALCCPACGADTLHRDGLRIRDSDSIALCLWCEGCAEVSELHIESITGRIFFAWR